MPTAPYNRDSYNMCLCGGCPVNRSSDCIKEQEKAIAPQFEKIEKESVMPPKEGMPGIYCAAAKSACSGSMDGDKSCLCPACPVHIEFGLGNNYYCLKGSAEEVG